MVTMEQINKKKLLNLTSHGESDILVPRIGLVYKRLNLYKCECCTTDLVTGFLKKKMIKTTVTSRGHILCLDQQGCQK